MGNIYRFVEPVLLLMLRERGKSYGYDLSTHLEAYALTDGQIERAILYRTLRQLEANGYVRSSWDVGAPGPARRMYSLTKDGEQHLREWGQVLGKLSGAMARFARAAKSVSRG
jgi:PadR family transcriptional regulator